MYLPENWAKVLEMREDAANGGTLPEGTRYAEGSAGMQYETALVWLRYSDNVRENTVEKRLAFSAAENAFLGARDEWFERNNYIEDELYYRLMLWKFRAECAYRGGEYHSDFALYLRKLFNCLNMTLEDFLDAPYMEQVPQKVRDRMAEDLASPLPADSKVSVLLDQIRIFTENDAKPEFQNNRIMVPIRAIAEMLGADVDWRKETNEAVLTRAGVTIVLPIGGSTATVNGQAVELDAPSYVSRDRTMVPLRFVSEVFGQSVVWNPFRQEARISEDKSVAGASSAGTCSA